MPKTTKTTKRPARLNEDKTPEKANSLHKPPLKESNRCDAGAKQNDPSTPDDRYGRLVTESNLSNGSRLSLAQGDLTGVPVDAIVNAANEELQLGSGLAGAIRRKGGPSIQIECDQWVLANGKASPQRPGVTRAGNLAAKWIIHAVAPIWKDGKSGEPQDLHDAYSSSLA